MTRTPKLAVDGVWKSFGERTVLADVSLDVAEHDVVCVIGSSGSGKSTLLRCVNLLESIDDGEIRLDGTDITEPGLDENALRRRIGIVFQSFNLFPHLTVRANVTLGPRRALGRSKEEAAAQADELLGRFGLAGHRDAYPDQLSGGQQQRVSIVRSLAMEPELMLLDEVTSALDPELVGEVLAVIGELKASGMTMVLATHEMAFARDIADKVCFLDGGRIVEEGPPAQVLGAPTQARTQQFLRHFIDARRL
jgi:polar amino acid transport system ATP-binding protein